jgi:diguanylate cyclase (GGDEF)-like protein
MDGVMASRLENPMTRLVAAAVFVLAVGAFPGSVVTDVGLPVYPGVLPWWVIGVAFLLAEAFASAARRRGDAIALSPHAAALALGLFLLGPFGLVAAQILGAGAALVLLERSLRYGLFRLVTLTASVIVAASVFFAVFSLEDLRRPLGWATALVAVGLAALTESAVGARIAGAKRDEDVSARRALLLTLAGAVAGVGVAVAAIDLVRIDRGVAALLVLPFVSSAFIMWHHTAAHRHLLRLTLLYDLMRPASRVAGTDAGVGELLDVPRQLVGVDVAWLVLLPRRPGEPVLVASAAPEGFSPLRPTALGSRVDAVRAESRSPRGRVVSVDQAEDVLHGILGSLHLRRAISLPLHGESGVLGLLLVGDREGGTAVLGNDALRLLEAFAAQAAVMLENDRLEQSVSDLNALKEQLHQQAYHDSLTGLANRALFAEQVAASLDHPSDGAPAVLFLDLDDFKTINDSLGHHAGDELLTAVAGRVRHAIRVGDLPARLGGDEFAVLARSHEEGDAEAVAERLVAALDAPFTIAGREMSVHASVGIAIGIPGVTTADEILRNADTAMYTAKQGGKGSYATNEPLMHQRVRHRQELISGLERAVERNEIEVHYQPIVDLASGRIVAVEALARWDRPAHGMLAPDTFIPLADEVGLMVEIGRAVMREACRQVASWRSSFPGMDDLRVTVNLAPTELVGRSLADEVAAMLEETGLPADRLVLEITESGVMRNPDDVLETMRSVQKLGVSLALDDFGTGHSSLALLREFPIDTLKIAREFVTGIPESHVDTAFVDTIVRLAHSLGHDVVVEGVETERQANAVVELGCEYGQGYYYGAPLAPLGVSYTLGKEPGGSRLRVA